MRAAVRARKRASSGAPPSGESRPEEGGKALVEGFPECPPQEGFPGVTGDPR